MKNMTNSKTYQIVKFKPKGTEQYEILISGQRIYHFKINMDVINACKSTQKGTWGSSILAASDKYATDNHCTA